VLIPSKGEVGKSSAFCGLFASQAHFIPRSACLNLGHANNGQAALHFNSKSAQNQHNKALVLVLIKFFYYLLKD